jgi:hypothetical protein
MGSISADHAFTASSGCKYVYAVLYVATAAPSAPVHVTLDWLPDTIERHGGVASFNYLSAEKFEFDASRVEGRYAPPFPHSLFVTLWQVRQPAPAVRAAALRRRWRAV